MPTTSIISLGGSIIVPDRIDVDFLKQFKALVLQHVRQGHRFVVICGGGGTNKSYNKAAQEIAHITNDNLDWLGIATTKLNAELLRVILADVAYEKVIDKPGSRVKTAKPVIIASGWKPGCSSDHDAVLWAENLKAKEIINLSNIDYVYDRDPKLPGAKPVERIRWEEYRKIAGDSWSPRMSVPFDPIASRLAMKLKLKVMFAKGTEIGNLKNILEGRSFKGTTIGPE